MKSELLSISLFLAILHFGIGFQKPCPDKIEPCTCKNVLAYGLQILCTDFTDTQTLVNVLTRLRHHEVSILILHNLVLNDIFPKDVFQDLNINEISVGKSTLIFPQPAFKGLDKSLERLKFTQNSMIKSSEKFEIARLNNLTELSMKGTTLKVVKNNWLNKKIPSIVKITLDENGIKKIESQAFAELRRLSIISIASNRLKDVKRSMFPMPAENLTAIDLSYNEIKVLPEDFFMSMPVLEEVKLPGNDLTTLDEKTWMPVWTQLKVVYISDNSLECDNSLSWIMKVGWPEDIKAECVGPDPLEGRDLKDAYNKILT